MEKIRAMVAKNFTPISAPKEKPKKKAAKTFVPTPPEQVNQELLSLLNPERIPKESRTYLDAIGLLPTFIILRI